MTLRIVAEHADVWHSFGDVATMKHKSAVLDEWCEKVGRDPAEIQRSTTVARLDGSLNDPDEFLEIGLTDFRGTYEEYLAQRDGGAPRKRGR